MRDPPQQQGAGMSDKVVEAAVAYVTHVRDCPVCTVDGEFCCRAGGQLLVDFQALLDVMLTMRQYDA